MSKEALLLGAAGSALIAVLFAFAQVQRGGSQPLWSVLLGLFAFIHTSLIVAAVSVALRRSDPK